MAQVLVTGSAGFIGGYVVQELLDRGYGVVGLDNHSKYGRVDASPTTTTLPTPLSRVMRATSTCSPGCSPTVITSSPGPR